MEVLIDKMLQADFSRAVTSELNRPVVDTTELAEEVSPCFLQFFQ